jgi:Skp family chaperone for outer membrane proteins
VIGIIAVPDVMRASSAAQQIERVIGERRQKLNEDAQKEQVAWREIQQQIVAQRGSLTPDQIRAKERDLQARITDTQRRFRDRNRIIQEAVQYSLAQIERTLSGVLQQIAASRGMNMILHRAQVALNVAEFDISGQAVEELNKILPSVLIPPDGVSPSAMPPVTQGTTTPAAPAPVPAAAAAPTPTPPTAPPAKPKR